LGVHTGKDLIMAGNAMLFGYEQPPERVYNYRRNLPEESLWRARCEKLLQLQGWRYTAYYKGLSPAPFQPQIRQQKDDASDHFTRTDASFTG
jgi:hypothetical protein